MCKKYILAVALLGNLGWVGSLTVSSQTLRPEPIRVTTTKMCNPVHHLTEEYRRCTAELSSLSKRQRVVVEDNSQVVRNLELEINSVVESNSDIETTYETEIKELELEYKVLVEKRKSLRGNYTDLDAQINELVKMNLTLKDEAERSQKTNSEIRAKIEEHQALIEELKRSCKATGGNSGVIIGSGTEDSMYS